MKPGSFDRIQLEHAVQRCNPLWVLMVVMLSISLVVWFGVLPNDRRQLAMQDESMQILRTQNLQAPVERVNPAVSGQDLQAVLGHISETEQYVDTLLALVQSLGMTAPTGEYKLSCDAIARLCRYRVRLPLVGSYLQIRAFVEQSLLALPLASLDELSLRREGVGSDEVEAGLVFSLHLAYPAQGQLPVEDVAP
ncbi:MAG: hypothetical protein HQ445_13310 [Polaromonas sp.]|nr:hypothetical protein [Polaromonas sp.]